MVTTYMWHQCGMEYVDEAGKAHVFHRMVHAEFVTHADYKALKAKCESLEYHGRKMAEEIGSLTAELAECRKALVQIRDSTFRNATTLRGIADQAIARSKA